MTKQLAGIIVFVLAAIVVGCKPTQPKGEGIIGQVYWLEGNVMPQIGDPSGAPREIQARQKVKRKLRIHQLTHLDDVSLGDYLIGSINTELMAEIETDESGHFEVRLPVGTYSIFTVEEEGFFANVFDINNHINPVEVVEKEWSFLEILIDYKAAY